MKWSHSLGLVIGFASAVLACKSDSPAASSKADAPLIAADIKPPAGVSFARVDVSSGSIEFPTGAGWRVAGDQAEHSDRTTILIQIMYNTEPTRLDELLESYDEGQRHDVPKYKRTAHRKGTIGGEIAARIEATYDGGTKFVIRDYLRFKNGKGISISGRTPATNAAALAPLVDYVVASMQFK